MTNCIKIFGMIMLSVSLFACQVRYHVSFETNSETSIDDVTVDDGGSLAQPVDPIKTGHTFLGWFDETLEIPFYFNQSIVTEDLTLYAKWAVNFYTMTYEDSEGNILIVISYPYGTDISSNVIEVPEREGFVVLGWNPLESLTMPAHDIVVTPAYAPIAYDLNLYSDKELVQTLTVTYGQQVTLPLLSDDTLTFLGWTSMNGEVISTYTHNLYQTQALSAVWEYEIEDITYHMVEDKAYLVSYEGNATELVIPDDILGYPVTSIEEDAFKDNQSLISILLGEHVSSIGDFAFSGMEALEYIEMQDQAYELGDLIFYESSKIESMVLSSRISKSLSQLFGGLVSDIPQSLTYIKFASGGPGYSFYFMSQLPFENSITIELGSSLTKITDHMLFESRVSHLVIPKSVVAIEKYGLFGLSSLKSITFEENSTLTFIGEEAFFGTAIETIDLPETLEFIDQTALRWVPMLNHISIDSDNANYADVDGVLYPKDMKELMRYPSQKTGDSYIVPDSVEIIRSFAFYYANYLSEIVFSSTGTLNKVGDYVFYGMNNLTQLELPEGLEEIGSHIYRDNMKLSYIIIPASVMHMAAHSFPNYMLVKHVIYMKAVAPSASFEPGWDDTRFSIVFGYQETVIVQDIQYALKVDGTAVLLDAEGTRSEESLVIPEMVGTYQVTEIGAFSFLLQAELVSVILPTSIEKIGYAAFSLCTSLEDINLEELVELKEIGARAFERTSLVDVVLPDQLETIRAAAFINMDMLLTLYIPSSVTLVEGGIVQGSELVQIRLEAAEVPSTWIGFWNYVNRPVVYSYVIVE